ncbi:LrgB family protein [Thalassotalea castellviae]|uniref:LrgB family protein n=1 Tax=Thalassotalea castellviae TaxID=3075612 RepID=A0ABU3A0J4_9GAMM|nr:LrgB family protein [Thalassotalea sp. W431]MDT0603393.1 LrgB family protein [Thalassotalea sp. W431]
MIDLSLLTDVLLYSGLTLAVYHSFVRLQQKTGKIWLNPMLLCIFVLIFMITSFEIDFQQYRQSTSILSNLLEPAVIALGFPLYQHLNSMKSQWKQIVSFLTISISLLLSISYILTMLLIKSPSIAVSLSFKSITTPVGIALTEQLNGNSAITAFAIILAGLFGAIFGIKWLTFIKVSSPKAQGLAIGTASHALGTATVSQLSYQHAAYSSLALIISATITAIVSPSLIHQLDLLLF